MGSDPNFCIQDTSEQLRWRKIYRSWTVGRSRDPAALWTPARLFLKPEIFGLSLTRERNKNLSEFYLSKIEALCVIWASGQVNADITTIEKAIQASGSKLKMTTEDLKACVTEIQGVLVS